jgi:hypothetical protein
MADVAAIKVGPRLRGDDALYLRQNAGWKPLIPFDFHKNLRNEPNFPPALPAASFSNRPNRPIGAGALPIHDVQ